MALSDVSLIVYPAADLAAAKAFFREFTGSDPYADSAYYVGYKIGEFEIGLDPNGANYGAGPIAFLTVPDIAASLEKAVDAGGTVVTEPTDVGYGMLVARVKEPNGSVVGFRQMPKGQ